MSNTICSISLLLFLSTTLWCQSAHKLLRKGDEAFDWERYKDAERHYRDAADLHYGDPQAAYNLGNALYQQGKWEDAEARFGQAARTATDRNFKADALHNLGNALLKQGKYKEAVDAYENSLRLRPGDAGSKQNLQMAKKKLKKEEENQKPQSKEEDQPNQQQQPPPSQQEQNQQPQPPQNELQNQPKQQPNQGQQQEQQPPESPQKLKKEEARRLLETAIGPEDQKNAKKYREQRQQPQRSDRRKDW